MICDECSWNYTNEILEFCENFKKNGFDECSRFYQIDEDLKPKNDNICKTCKRAKDPGKCWWCGNE